MIELPMMRRILNVSNGKRKEDEGARISPDELLSVMGRTPADNLEGLATSYPWKSKITGQLISALFKQQKTLEAISKDPLHWGPLSFTASLQNAMMERYLTGPVKAHARLAARAGRNPDIFGDMNGWIYKNYARLLHSLTGYFIRNGHFDRRKARLVSSSPEGHTFLREYIDEFLYLERNYSSIGLTRLKAMKDLLKSLLIVITEKPLTGEPPPFTDGSDGGMSPQTFEKYLDENRRRMENLHHERAFDLKEFSEWATLGKIGYSSYEVVEGSELHGVVLRHYPLPANVQPNGRVLYMATPLINKPEIFDLARGKSVIEGMLKEGFEIYLVDHGEPGPEDAGLGLDFYGKTVPETYLGLIHERHPGRGIYVVGYCMGGTIILPYLARRAEERLARGEAMDIRKVALMASPVIFDDGPSGHGSMREVIRRSYDPVLMEALYASVNIPPQLVEAGMNEIQPGVQYTVSLGFYGRASHLTAIHDSAHFLYWLTHGTKFPARAHREWIEKIFLGNEICEGKYRLPSSNPALDGKPVDMGALREAGVTLFDYRGTRDPIAPPGSCRASEMWGQVQDGNIQLERGGLNRTIEKNIGHIFVVSKKLLAEYLEMASAFLK
jgi:poly(3-hydroxyalkanoate) synthetase